jgi:hypothetical protein
MGQKVPIERPRVRTTDDKEVRLGSYEMFHRPKSGRWQSMTPVPARTIMAGLLIKELLIRGDLINDIKSLLSG